MATQYEKLSVAMKRDFNTLETQPSAHIKILGSVTDTISTANTWQKLDLSTGTPVIKCAGGFTWNATNENIVWDEGDIISLDLVADFIGDAQVQITSVVPTDLVLELGLVLNSSIDNPNTVPPIIITPTSYTTQGRISSYGANEMFIEYTSPSSGDVRLNSNDNLEVWIRCTDVAATPTFKINGMNVKFKGR